MKISSVLCALERFAPLPLQEDYDNAGLQIGLTEAEVSGALLCLDVTPAIVDEAVEKGCNLIISHHPLLFHPLRHITASDDVQRVVMKAVKDDIAIISMHTNMDAAEGGVNYKMAEKIGLSETRFIGKQQEVDGVRGGEGVIGILPQEMTADAFIRLLQTTFEAQCVMANALLDRPVHTVALCGGAGSFLLSDAISAGADAFVTGEMHYHEYFGHDQEIQICVIGHYESEHFTMEIFRDILAKNCPGIRIVMTQQNTNPIIINGRE